MKLLKNKGLFQNKVLNNASWIIGCKIFQSVLSLIVNMLTARYLGPSNYGIINYAASIVAFFTPLMQLGLNSTIVQELVTHPKDEGKVMGTALLMNLCSGVCCVAGIAAYALIANGDEPVTVVVCILYSSSMIAQALELTQYWFQSKFKSKYQSLSALGAYVIVSAYQIWLLASGKSVLWFAVTYTIQYLLIAASLMVLYRVNHGQPFRVSLAMGKDMFSRSHYYIVSSLMVTIFAQTDKIMIKMMIGNDANGYYSAAVACAGLFTFVFTAICDSARPAILQAFQEDKEKFERNVIRLYSVIIYLSLAQCLGTTIFAKLAIHILYGSAYDPAIPALRLIVWYCTFSYLGIVRNIWILAEQQQKYLWVINLIGAAANVVVNFILIPVMGIMGASLASLLTQFFTNVIVGFIIRPIRRNNTLMLKGLDPRCLLELLPSKKK